MKENIQSSSPVDQFVHGGLLVLHKEATVETAARAMSERGMGAVVVSDHEGHLIGMVTDRDLVCRVLAHGRSGEVLVKEIMSTPLLSVKEGQDIDVVVETMINQRVRRVAIVKEKGKGKLNLVGFISLDDLICNDQISLNQAKEIIQAQMRKRIKIAPEVEPDIVH